MSPPAGAPVPGGMKRVPAEPSCIGAVYAGGAPLGGAPLPGNHRFAAEIEFTAAKAPEDGGGTRP